MTVALLETTRPLAKKKLPPSSCNAAGLEPSPTTKGNPFETTALLAWKVPPLKMNWPEVLVKNKLSVVTVPWARVKVPPDTSK